MNSYLGLALVVGGAVRLMAPAWRKSLTARTLQAVGLNRWADGVAGISNSVVRIVGLASIIVGIVLIARW